jgi:hypothetical protein
METQKFEFKNGCMWEGGSWEIHLNYECSELGGGEPCKHCGPITIKENQRFDDSIWFEKVWICPRIVVAANEGGYNSTGVCLDCILEAAATLPK